MKNFKRPIVILLALLMVMTLFTPAVLATEVNNDMSSVVTDEDFNFDDLWEMWQEFNENFELELLQARHSFNDVRDGQWYSSAIQFVYANGIMQGVNQNQFNTQGNLTRAEVTALIFRLHHGRRANASDSRQNHFTDVGNGWYSPYITWANANNIDNGTVGLLFEPNRHATRQEFATMMFRYAILMTDLTDTGQQGQQWNQFTDRGQIASWAYQALRWMNFHGVIQGRTTTTINPTGTLTRAESATIFMRFMNLDGGGNQGNGGNNNNQGGNNNDNQGNNNNQQQPNNNLTPAQAEIEFVRLLNQHRARYGLRPVTMHTGLQDVARAHSQDMVNRNFFGHTCPSGTNYRARVMNNTTLNAEFTAYLDPNGIHPANIAYQPLEVLSRLGSDFNNPQRSLQNLLNSTSHRNVLMNPNNYFIGVGLVDGHWCVKLVRPTGGTPLHISGTAPPVQHEFNPQ